jgi:hypothetical protein
MELRPRFLRVLFLAGVVAGGAACSPASENPNPAIEGAEVIGAGAPKLCAAVRGNGTHIVAHFTSLARIIEHYGTLDGIAGGSSGSITTFLYDSILKNPAVMKCGAGECSASERAARVSLALKSLQGYAMAAVSSPEGTAITDLVAVASRLKNEVEARGIGALVSSDAALAAEKLLEVTQIPEVKGLVNPEVVAMLRDTEHLEFNVREIYTSVSTLGAFSVTDNRLFFRPGVIDWNTLAGLLGRVGDFYAGYGDAAALGKFMDGCAVASVGKTWDEAAALPYPTGGTCGDVFAKIVSDYRAEVRSTGVEPRRLSERIGAPSALRKLVSTSVLTGDAVRAYHEARAAYLSGAHPSGSVPFDVSFDDVGFGYWGAARDLAGVTSDARRFGDLKTQKAISLGDATWREILTASPAEPGLSRFVELADGRISAGGWSDLAPTLVLANMGCERVIYVTRAGDESSFATAIAKNLGMSEADWRALYDLANPTSSFNLSLETADAVWCTDWNAFSEKQQREIAADAWSAPLEMRAGFDALRPLTPYANTTASTGKPGCTPGISGGATYPR